MAPEACTSRGTSAQAKAGWLDFRNDAQERPRATAYVDWDRNARIARCRTTVLEGTLNASEYVVPSWPLCRTISVRVGTVVGSSTHCREPMHTTQTRSSASPLGGGLLYAVESVPPVRRNTQRQQQPTLRSASAARSAGSTVAAPAGSVACMAAVADCVASIMCCPSFSCTNN